MSDGIEADVKAAKAAIETKKVSEAIDSIKINDGGETRDLIYNDDAIGVVDNGDAPIGGASIDSIMDDGSFGNAYFSDGGDFVRKSNDFNSFTQATVVESTYSAPKKG